ncbi:MAG: ABC transporter ATP-binding protein [Lachnospiraceae bacterium]
MIKIIRKFFAFCGEENRKKFHLSIVLGVIQAMFEALKIPAIAVMIEPLLQNKVTAKAILMSFVIMLISIIGSSIVKYFSTMLQTEGGYGTCANKRIEIAEHLRYLPMGYFNANSLGEIASVTTNTMQQLENVATRVVMLVSQGLLTTALIIIFLLFFDYRISLVLLTGLVLFLLANSRLQKSAEKISQKKVGADAALVEKVLEYIQGIAEVKAYRLTGRKSCELNDAIDVNANTNIELERTLIPYMTLQSFVVKLTGVAMTLLSVLFYLNGSMKLLICVVMVISSFIVYSSLESAGNYSALLRAIDASIDKARQILDAEQMDINGADTAPDSCDIQMSQVDFSYGERKIIDGISAFIPEKTTTAIVGPSGGGKTTLTSLIARFWDADSGKVLLGGRNVKDYSMDSLMKNFSFVFQSVYLFHDTIANNIRFGQPDASMERVMDAAKKACCHNFISALPAGYETVIGEGGASLSGGERQRISIARAIMKDAPIVILDEATANVDPENEADLITAINALTQEKTIIMIAHRLKTVRIADQILVVDKGKIVQQGTHEQLMQQDGIYRNFVDDRKRAVSWKI